MIIICKPEATDEQIGHIEDAIRKWGLKPHTSRGVERTIIGVIGPEDLIREKPLAAFPGVASVTPVMKPYKLTSYDFTHKRTVIDVRGVQIGDQKKVVLMSGPCSVESREQILSIAQIVKKAGATVLRGGAFKPRTSPYTFQGLGKEGLKLLAEAREATGLPVITEVMDTKDLDMVEEYADIIQIGARNMQNFSLLKEVGRCKRSRAMLKRGMAATVKDVLLSAGIHSQRRQHECHALRARHSDIRDVYPQHARSFGRAGAQEGVALAGDCRSDARRGSSRFDPHDGAGGGGGGRGRDHDRSP